MAREESEAVDVTDERPLLCQHCFQDHGLRLMAADFDAEQTTCPNCGTENVLGLTRDQLLWLSQVFFVRGSIERFDYGTAPAIQFNERQTGSLDPAPPLAGDIDLLQRTLGIGFFHYGPRLWMLGNITPLEQLRSRKKRPGVIKRIIAEYPTIELGPDVRFYRVRKAPARPDNPAEYDAPPAKNAGSGRLDTPERPVLYGSQDLEVCVHECRFAAGDELFVATLTPRRQLKLLDLSAILPEDCTEFESLDLAVHMLFLAGDHSYEISRAIAAAAADHGFDGLVYPSYFSLLRTGAMPLETAYGLSLRRIPSATEYEQSKVIANLALFGHPVAAGSVDVSCINRLVINRVAYGMSFGPVTY